MPLQPGAAVCPGAPDCRCECTRAGAGMAQGRGEAALLAGVACRCSAAEGIPPRAPSPRQAMPFAGSPTKASSRDFVRASEPGVREAASLEQRAQALPKPEQFTKELAGKSRGPGSPRGEPWASAAQPGSRGRGSPVPRLRRAAESSISTGQPSLPRGAGPHLVITDWGRGSAALPLGLPGIRSLGGSRRPLSFIPHPASYLSL